jgi:hypothetical protein
MLKSNTTTLFEKLNAKSFHLGLFVVVNNRDALGPNNVQQKCCMICFA